MKFNCKTMNKLFVLLLFCLFAYGQNSLLTTDYPDKNTLYLAYVVDTTMLTPGNSGANITWDFSLYPLYSSYDSIAYFTPQNAPDANNFPTATLAYKQVVNFMLISVNRYMFSVKNNSEFVDLGFHIPFTDLTTSVAGVYLLPQSYTYQQPDTLVKFPFNYGDSLSFPEVYSEIIVGFPPNDTMIYSHSQRTVVADGYGTIKLPSGRIFNAIRVKETIHKIDTIRQLSPPVVDLYSHDLTITNYYWYVKDTGLVFYQTYANGLANTFMGPIPLNDKQAREINPPKNPTKLTVNNKEQKVFLKSGNLYLEKFPGYKLEIYNIFEQKLQ